VKVNIAGFEFQIVLDKKANCSQHYVFIFCIREKKKSNLIKPQNI